MGKGVGIELRTEMLQSESTRRVWKGILAASTPQNRTQHEQSHIFQRRLLYTYENPLYNPKPPQNPHRNGVRVRN